MAPGNEQWMGTPEAAEYLGVVLRTVYRLIDKGELPAYKMGRVMRIKRDDLDDFLEAHKVQPGDLKHLYPEAVVSDDTDDTDDA